MRISSSVSSFNSDLRMHFSKSASPTSGPTFKSDVVELIGIEPMTPGLQTRCSPS
jgi:hypothetical protein